MKFLCQLIQSYNPNTDSDTSKTLPLPHTQEVKIQTRMQSGQAEFDPGKSVLSGTPLGQASEVQFLAYTLQLLTTSVCLSVRATTFE